MDPFGPSWVLRGPTLTVARPGISTGWSAEGRWQHLWLTDRGREHQSVDIGHCPCVEPGVVVEGAGP